MRAGLAAFALLAALALPGVAAADGPVLDRPDVANSTSTIDRGHAQIELGLQLSHVSRAHAAIRTPLLLRTGLARGLELRLGGDGLHHESGPAGVGTGVGDLVLGFKARFCEEGWLHPSVGLEPLLVVPVATRGAGLGTGRPALGGNLLFSKSLPGGFSADLNVGGHALGVEGSAGDYHPQLAGALSVSRAFLGHRVIPFWEVYARTSDAPGEPDHVATDFGVLVQVHRRVVLDGAFDVGLADATHRFQTHAGVTVLFDTGF